MVALVVSVAAFVALVHPEVRAWVVAKVKAAVDMARK